MAEVIPGIHRLQLPIPFGSLGHINPYLIQLEGGYLLIDTGWNTEEVFNSLKEQLAEIGISLEDIKQILITHIHRDHYGLVGKLKQLSQAEITTHYADKELIESRYINLENLLQQVGKLPHSHGLPQDELSELKRASMGMLKYVSPTMPDVMLQGSETISTRLFNFQVIWTPGHSPGHICLYEPVKKVLFSGDHLLPTISPHIGFHPQSSKNPLGDYINSLNKIKQLDVNLVLPGHEKPFTNLATRIEGLIKHHTQRSS